MKKEIQDLMITVNQELRRLFLEVIRPFCENKFGNIERENNESVEAFIEFEPPEYEDPFFSGSTIEFETDELDFSLTPMLFDYYHRKREYCLSCGLIITRKSDNFWYHMHNSSITKMKLHEFSEDTATILQELWNKDKRDICEKYEDILRWNLGIEDMIYVVQPTGSEYTTTNFQIFKNLASKKVRKFTPPNRLSTDALFSP